MRPSWICLELAIDLLTMPLGYIALQIGALLVLGGLAAWLLPGAGLATWPLLALVLLGVLALHALRGWQLSPLGPRALLDLLRVPFFVLWKLYVLLRNRRNKHWIRTDRDSK